MMSLKCTLRQKPGRPPFSLIPFLVVVSLTQCAGEFRGCGPGDIPSNPISSNLVRFTDPPSGSILKITELEKLTFVFLRRVHSDTFSTQDDMRLFYIIDYGKPSQHDIELKPISAVVKEVHWPDEPTGLCDQDGNCYKLELSIDTSYLTEGVYYRFRILGETPSKIGFPGDRPQNYISSDEGEILRDDVDVVVKLTPDPPPNTNPTIETVEPPSIASGFCDPFTPGFDSTCLVKPHQRLQWKFSEEMAFVNFAPNPYWGFNFRTTSDEETLLESDSRQGLDPGQLYSVWFHGARQPAFMGIANTMDIDGNPLDPIEVRHWFKTSHARILFPVHNPFSDVPDDWYNQLGNSFDFPIIHVEATPDVMELRSTDRFGNQSEIVFEDVPLDPGRTQNSFHTIEVVGVRSDCDPNSPVTLEVHAYDGTGPDANWLGVDKLEVYVHERPPAPNRIKIVTFNAWAHNKICGFELPEECNALSWPPLCFDTWLRDEPLPSECTSITPFEDYPPWPDMCRGYWNAGVPFPPEYEDQCNPEDAPWPGFCLEYYDVARRGSIGTCLSWRRRLAKFVKDVVLEYRPAIIALQEVYIRSDCGWDDMCSNCEDISPGVWMSYLLSLINEGMSRENRGGGEYFIATTQESGTANVCLGKETGGEAIIYDPGQVGFVRPTPLGGSPFCSEQREGQEMYYEDRMEPNPILYNECMKRNVTDSQVVRSIFEFPIGSRRYFNFFNSHTWPRRYSDEFSYIISIQESFDVDLSYYLEDPNEPYWIYPPIYAGDMNIDKDTPDWENIREFIFAAFLSPVEYQAMDGDIPLPWYERRGLKDFVWVGRDEYFTSDYGFGIITKEIRQSEYEMEHPGEDYCNELIGKTTFRCTNDGLTTLYRIYSDHSITLVEIAAEDP